MNTYLLKFSPINQDRLKKLPSELIYIKDFKRAEPRLFTMFSTKNIHPTPYTHMKCSKQKILNINNKTLIPSLYIHILYSNPSGQGLGSKMLDFAQKYSKELDCNGRFHLSADYCFTPKRVPHIFYRKYGMNTGIKKIDKKLDKFIKAGKNGTVKDFDQIRMYYPPIEYPTSKMNCLITKIKHFLSINK